MPARTGCDESRDQYTLPVSGSSELTDSGCQTISCLTPPAPKITGEQYPGSLALNARQISWPVFLSSATTVELEPPARQINLFPSSSGFPAKPHIGVLIL